MEESGQGSEVVPGLQAIFLEREAQGEKGDQVKTTPNLVAFHGDPEVKEKYLSRVREHRAADEIVQGYYWEKGKGCAVGCSVHSSSHAAYESEMGIPRQLAYIEDGIFEALKNGEAKVWPENFLEAIPVGADLYPAYWEFMRWLLVGENDGVIKFANTERSRGAIQAVADLYSRLLAGGTVTESEWRDAAAAAYAAYAAAYAADAATAYAAYAADAAAYAAAYAADAATAYAADAADAAYAAAYAADAAAAYAAYAATAYAADAATAATAYAADAATADTARLKARQRQAEKLLELLRAAKGPNETITHGALVQADEPRGADSENRDAAGNETVGSGQENERVGDGSQGTEG